MVVGKTDTGSAHTGKPPVRLLSVRLLESHQRTAHRRGAKVILANPAVASLNELIRERPGLPVLKTQQRCKSAVEWAQSSMRPPSSYPVVTAEMS